MGLNEKFFKSAAGGIVADENFNIVLYTGNATNRTITGVGFQPDLVWTKSRTLSNRHQLYDSVRGATKAIESDTTFAESTESTALTAFATDGFSIGTSGNVNSADGGGVDYVAWNWYAPTSETNTSGTITTTIKKNVAAGFSILTYDGATNATSDTSNNGGGYYSVGHGLGVAPALVIVKKTSGAGGWYVGGTALGSTGSNGNHMVLNTDAALASESNILWGGGQTFNATTFGLGGWDVVNRKNDSYVAYCFANVTGYQKVGSYTGGGASNVTVSLDFEPRWIMVKGNAAGYNWVIWDQVRKAGTVPYDNDFVLFANTDVAEKTNSTARGIQFTSTGFVLNQNNILSNDSGVTYIFLAIA